MEKRFGAFNGVFLPTFLTIIGVIFYLRFGWIVGNAGVLGTLAIVILAHIITISTSLSMASITTNMEVKGGGAYFLISRSLGLEIGGSIGIPLYLSQTISVALYVLGFIESLQLIFPDVNKVLLSICVTITIGIISILGANLAIKMQYGIFGIIVLSLITIFTSGSYSEGLTSVGSFEVSGNFWSTFAIFFPAVTGILAGVSMSGDLKDPRSNIPKGTFYAIAITFLIYTLAIFWFVFNVPTKDLIDDKLVLINRTRFPIFILGGIWAATLSSALGSMIAAPRTMQALALDSVLPKFLGKGKGKTNEPQIATFISLIIALIFVTLVDLDFVAPVITMFFLNTYGAINMVATLESLVENPSYRPTFKTHWIVSLIGALGSYSVMFLINGIATIICLTFTLIIYFYLGKKQIKRTWGDLRDGILVSIIRICLLKLRFNKIDEKNWKPDILVYSENPKTRDNLIYLAKHFTKGSGIVTLVKFINGSIKDNRENIKKSKTNLNNFLKKQKLPAFSEVIVGEDLSTSFVETLQTNGIGLLKPNTVLIGNIKKKEKIIPLIKFIRDTYYLKKNMLMFSSKIILKSNEKKTSIDIWWGGLEENGELMLNLAYLMTLNNDWREAKIRLLSIAKDKSEFIKRKNYLDKILNNLRIKAEINIIIEKTNLNSTICLHSSKSDLILMGLSFPENGRELEYYNKITTISKNLNSVLFVKGSIK